MLGYKQLVVADESLIKPAFGKTAVGAVLLCEKNNGVVGFASGHFLNSRVGCVFFGDGALVCQHAVLNVIELSVTEFLCLAVVPVLYRAIIACNSGINLGCVAALGAGELLTCEVAVILADGISGRNRIIGKSVILGNLAYKICG